MRHIKIIKNDKLGFSVFLIFTLQFLLNPVNYLLYCLDSRCSFQIIYFDHFTLQWLQSFLKPHCDLAAPTCCTGACMRTQACIYKHDAQQQESQWAVQSGLCLCKQREPVTTRHSNIKGSPMLYNGRERWRSSLCCICEAHWSMTAWVYAVSWPAVCADMCVECACVCHYLVNVELGNPLSVQLWHHK